MADIQDTVAGILAGLAGIEPARVTREARFSDLGLDSLAMIDAAIAIEDSLAIRLPDDDLERAATVGDLVDYITHAATGRRD